MTKNNLNTVPMAWIPYPSQAHQSRMKSRRSRVLILVASWAKRVSTRMPLHLSDWQIIS